jgi:hemolysin III
MYGTKIAFYFLKRDFMKSREMDQMSCPEFTPQQEFANIIIHLLGIIFAVIAIPFLIADAASESTSHLISVGVYSLCFFMVFCFSTLYHSVKKQKLKGLCKKLDRISIYFLIAGTYTPIIRFYLYDNTGIVLLCILWTLVVAGIFFEIFFPDKFNTFSVIFYLIMGLIFVFVPNHFFDSMPSGVVMLVLAGVALYCIGVIFYVWQKWNFHHAIWHSFVLVAGICHFVAMLQTVG